jgi:hypothetical protein
MDVLLVMLNASSGDATFRPPSMPGGKPVEWKRLLDSASLEIIEAEGVGETVTVVGHSLSLVFTRVDLETP